LHGSEGLAAALRLSRPTPSRSCWSSTYDKHHTRSVFSVNDMKVSVSCSSQEYHCHAIEPVAYTTTQHPPPPPSTPLPTLPLSHTQPFQPLQPHLHTPSSPRSNSSPHKRLPTTKTTPFCAFSTPSPPPHPSSQAYTTTATKPFTAPPTALEPPRPPNRMSSLRGLDSLPHATFRWADALCASRS